MPGPSPIDAQTFFDQLIRYSSPLLIIIASLTIYIYRSKVKDLETKLGEEKEDREAEVKVEKDDRKESILNVVALIKQIEDDVKEGIKEERNFRTEVMVKQGNQIDEINKRLEDGSVLFGKISQKLDSHMENQQTICRINHAKTAN